jgi:hypothetical protein
VHPAILCHQNHCKMGGGQSRGLSPKEDVGRVVSTAPFLKCLRYSKPVFEINRDSHTSLIFIIFKAKFVSYLSLNSYLLTYNGLDNLRLWSICEGTVQMGTVYKTHSLPSLAEQLSLQTYSGYFKRVHCDIISLERRPQRHG